MLLQEPSAVRYRAFGPQANILVGQLVKDVSDPPDWPGDISSSSKPYLYIRYRIVFAFSSRMDKKQTTFITEKFNHYVK